MTALVLSLLAAAALAGAPSSFVAGEEWRAGADVDRTLSDFARCMVRGQPKRAHAILMMPPAAAETEQRLLSWMAQRSRCLRVRGALRMRPPVMRGAIAETLYLETFSRPPAGGGIVPAAGPSSDDPILASYEVTQCAAARDPVAADRLVRSKRRSPEEVAAVDQLKPALSACARPRIRLDFNRTMIRSLMAEGIYKVRVAGIGRSGRGGGS